jgi:hypothetical protein
MNNVTPRHTVVEKPYGGYFVQDTKTEQRVVDCTDLAEARDCADALDRLAALNIQPGDTVTGWNTSTTHPRRISVTVDREPWPHGMHNLIVSDGRSVEALRVAGLTVERSGPETGECAQCLDVWPVDELRPDANLDAICPDCAATNEGVAEADAAAFRSYAYAGR